MPIRPRQIDQAERRLDQARGGARLRSWVPRNPEIEDTTMNTDVTLIDMPPTPIAYFRYTGPYGAGRALLDGAHGAVDGRERLVRPRALRHRPRRLDHHRACEVPLRRRRGVPPEEVRSGQPLRTVLPGGRYACTRFEGTSTTSMPPGSGCSPAGCRRAACSSTPGRCSSTTRSTRSSIPKTGVFDCKLCIPVKPL